MDIKDKIKKLIEDGKNVLATKYHNQTMNISSYFVDTSLFASWKSRITAFVANEFGKESEEYTFFTKIHNGNTSADYTKKYLKRLEDLLTDLESGLLETAEQNQSKDALEILSNMFKKFPFVARQLERRHQERDTLTISDEYDVQDLLHALLKLHFDNVKPEEYCPSYGGGQARTDFLLEDENILIEVKKTRNGLADKDITKQLIEDRAFYSKHPNCKTLFCFVYDPAHFITNKAAVIKDVENTKDLNVRVFIES